MSERHDIIIIGAGPGGVYAACKLAQEGIPSLVVDKSTFPRRKVCGDILTSNVLREMHRLDPELMAALLEKPWQHELTASTFASHRGKAIEMPFNSPSNAELGLPSCLSARRHDFDDFMLRYAANQSGVEIREGFAIKSILREKESFLLTGANGDKLHARYIILASGANSPLIPAILPGYKLNPKHSAVGLRAYYEDAEAAGKPGLSEFFLFERKLMPGGLYITPFSDGEVNVNIVMRYDTFRKRKVRLRTLMQEYLASQPQLRPRFANAKQMGQPEGCVLFFGTTRRPISAPGAVLVGDAAGLTDATNANGIGHAMISGGIAAATVARALAEGRTDAEFFRAYDKAVYERLSNALLPGKVMRLLFANRLSSRISASILQASFRRLNSDAVGELVYAPSTGRILRDPRFYWRLFAKEKG